MCAGLGLAWLRANDSNNTFLCQKVTRLVSELHLSHLKRQELEAERLRNATRDGAGGAGGAGGENCCACPKSEEEVQQEEEERMFQIEFENFLHNTVYHKRCVALRAEQSKNKGPSE